MIGYLFRPWIHQNLPKEPKAASGTAWPTLGGLSAGTPHKLEGAIVTVSHAVREIVAAKAAVPGAVAIRFPRRLAITPWRLDGL
jgi:hypothetical protein